MPSADITSTDWNGNLLALVFWPNSENMIRCGENSSQSQRPRRGCDKYSNLYTCAIPSGSTVNRVGMIMSGKGVISHPRWMAAYFGRQYATWNATP